MQTTVTHTSYTSAIKVISTLLGTDVDCLFFIEGDNVFIDASNMEAWVRVQLSASDTSGGGGVFSKLEYLQAIRPKVPMKMAYEDGSDHISIDMGKTRGAIRVIDEDEAMVEYPQQTVSISASMPAQLIIFSTGATAFKPLLPSSVACAILDIGNNELKLTSYDTYMGTIYKVNSSEVNSKSPFKLTIEMEYWKKIVGCISSGMQVKIGADDKQFRIKTEEFDLYHAVIDEDTQDVESVINSLRQENILAKIEFDGNEMVEAIDAAIRE